MDDEQPRPREGADDPAGDVSEREAASDDPPAERPGPVDWHEKLGRWGEGQD
jgi:hypothetical protein